VRLAALLVDDTGTAEEVVQDAFVKLQGVWERVESPEAYLRATVVNLSRSRLRRRMVARRIVPWFVPHAPSASERAMLRDDQREVIEALRALPRRQRECLVLRYYLDLSQLEIAAMLGVSTGTVKTHAHRGLAALETRLRGRV